MSEEVYKLHISEDTEECKDCKYRGLPGIAKPCCDCGSLLHSSYFEPKESEETE